jgi:NADH-quinone oxidoreductase subunit L
VFIALALLAVVLSALYMARLVLVVFFGPSKPENESIHESPWIMTLPLILLAFLAATVGFLAFNYTEDYPGFGGYLAGHGEFEVRVWLMVTSLVLAVAGVVVGWMTYRGGQISHAKLAEQFSGLRKIIINKYYLDDAIQWTIDKIILNFGRFVGVFDRVVINDTGADGTALSVRLSALKVRLIQTGKFYNYGMLMATGVIGLALIWWIVQT